MQQLSSNARNWPEEDTARQLLLLAHHIWLATSPCTRTTDTLHMEAAFCLVSVQHARTRRLYRLDLLRGALDHAATAGRSLVRLRRRQHPESARVLAALEIAERVQEQIRTRMQVLLGA